VIRTEEALHCSLDPAHSLTPVSREPAPSLSKTVNGFSIEWGPAPASAVVDPAQLGSKKLIVLVINPCAIERSSFS
jgi:hypothetical protein